MYNFSNERKVYNAEMRRSTENLKGKGLISEDIVLLHINLFPTFLLDFYMKMNHVLEIKLKINLSLSLFFKLTTTP